MLPVTVNLDFLPFQYEGMRLQEACFINGNPYFTRKAVGEFLEYPRPQKAIDNIIARNPHISDQRWSVTLKLRATDGKDYETEIYDPIGLQLIVFESRQPKAIQYKVAVAHLVYAFAQGKIKPKVWSPDRIAALKQILSYPPTFKRAALVRDLAGREDKTAATIYRWIDKIGGLKTRKGNKRHRSNAGQTLHPEQRQAALNYRAEHPKAGGKEIKRNLGIAVTPATINLWLKAA